MTHLTMKASHGVRTMNARVLFVDDDDDLSAAVVSGLGAHGFSVQARKSPADALELFRAHDFDALVTDMNPSGMSGIDLCQRILEIRSNVPVVFTTAQGTMDAAILAIRAGAHDFLLKPFEMEHLARAIEKGVLLARLREEVQRLERAVADTHRFGDLVGASPKMTELYSLLAKVADSDAPVLVTGETGTGKELAARAIHAKGARAKGPFVAVNCAAMPAQLLESELFGHTKGAFTDARRAKEGLFVAAQGGTLFLDEIAELPLELQPKLLRALQERTVRPIGATAETPFDARLIAATNRDLETMVEEQKFREDLYFRVNVIQVALPPLRARGGDVLLLAQHFLERIAARANKRVVGFCHEAAEKVMAYAWPGNVRELQNCVERAVALAAFDKILASDLPEKVRNFKSTQIVFASDDPTALVTLDELERRYVTRVLDGVSGNKSAAARILGVERKTLHRMLVRWGTAGELTKG